MRRPVVTYFEVDGSTARVHGDKPMTPESRAAMTELLRAVKNGSWRSAPMPPGWAATRLRILVRDDYVCWICAKGGADEVDHRIPVSRGGTDDDKNLAAAHRLCHRRKTGSESRGGTRARPSERHPGDL